MASTSEQKKNTFLCLKAIPVGNYLKYQQCVNARSKRKGLSSQGGMPCALLKYTLCYNGLLVSVFSSDCIIFLYRIFFCVCVKPKLLCSNHMESIAFSEANIYLLLSSYKSNGDITDVLPSAHSQSFSTPTP